MHLQVGAGRDSFPSRTLDQETIIFGFKWRNNRRVFFVVRDFLPPFLLQR